MENAIRFWVKVGLSVISGVVLFVAALLSFFTVEQYERGVVTTWGKFSYIAEPGLNFKIPFAQSVVLYRTDVMSFSVEKGVNTYTDDNQEVDVVFRVFYRLDPGSIQYVYQNAQNYEQRLFDIVVDRIKVEFGKVNVDSLAKQRGTVRDRIKGIVVADAQSLGVTVTDIQLPNIEYTTSYRKAVEAAAAAKAMVETREQEKQQAVRVAERAKIAAEGEANAAREKAKGDADARISMATAEARAIQMQGEAQAKAIRAQAEALGLNARLVELRKAERWNGALPVQMLSGVVPFMNFDAPKP